MLKIHLLQFDAAWEDPDENFRRVQKIAAASPPEKGSLLLFAEMFSTGFSLNPAKTREGPQKPGETFLRQMAASRGCAVLGGVTNLDSAGRALNQALAVSPERELCRYSKIHPFGPGGETKEFAA